MRSLPSADFEEERERELLELALQALLPAQEQVLGELLRERGRTAHALRLAPSWRPAPSAAPLRSRPRWVKKAESSASSRVFTKRGGTSALATKSGEPGETSIRMPRAIGCRRPRGRNRPCSLSSAGGSFGGGLKSSCCVTVIDAGSSSGPDAPRRRAASRARLRRAEARGPATRRAARNRAGPPRSRAAAERATRERSSSALPEHSPKLARTRQRASMLSIGPALPAELAVDPAWLEDGLLQTKSGEPSDVQLRRREREPLDIALGNGVQPQALRGLRRAPPSTFRPSPTLWRSAGPPDRRAARRPSGPTAMRTKGPSPERPRSRGRTERSSTRPCQRPGFSITSAGDDAAEATALRGRARR